MKGLMVVGRVAVVLGIGVAFVPIPTNENKVLDAGDVFTSGYR